MSQSASSPLLTTRPIDSSTQPFFITSTRYAPRQPHIRYLCRQACGVDEGDTDVAVGPFCLLKANCRWHFLGKVVWTKQPRRNRFQTRRTSAEFPESMEYNVLFPSKRSFCLWSAVMSRPCVRESVVPRLPFYVVSSACPPFCAALRKNAPIHLFTCVTAAGGSQRLFKQYQHLQYIYIYIC